MAHVDSSSVSQAISVCRDANELLSRAIRDLQSKYQEAGSNWRDAKYGELGSIVSECQQALSSPISDLAECQQTLQQILAAIQEYEEVSIN